MNKLLLFHYLNISVSDLLKNYLPQSSNIIIVQCSTEQ